MATFTAKTRRFHPAKGCRRIGNKPGVNAHHAILQRLRYAPHASQIARVEVRSQAVLGVIGHLNGGLFVIKGENGCQRAKRLFVGHFHCIGSKADQRWCEIVATQGVRVSTQKQLRTVINGILNVLTDFLNSILVNKRANINIWLCSIPHL